MVEHRAAQDRIHQLVIKVEEQLEQGVSMNVRASSMRWAIGSKFFNEGMKEVLQNQ